MGLPLLSPLTLKIIISLFLVCITNMLQHFLQEWMSYSLSHDYADPSCRSKTIQFSFFNQSESWIIPISIPLINRKQGEGNQYIFSLSIHSQELREQEHTFVPYLLWIMNRKSPTRDSNIVFQRTILVYSHSSLYISLSPRNKIYQGWKRPQKLF